MITKDEILLKKIPEHIAIIMDGNGRWAKKRGNQRLFGHKNGVKAVRDAVEGAGEIGVKHLTLYAFSTENWNRPKIEIEGLMSLLVSSIDKETGNLIENNVRLNAIGNLDSLPSDVRKKLEKSIAKTEKCDGLNLHLALSYSSRWEIVNAVKNMAVELKTGKLDPETISDEVFSSFLTTQNIPDPELLIRTSGELRLSNFLLWQLAYSELYFTETLWPDFRKEHLFEAVSDYQPRERRFGKTSEQLNTK